MEPATAEKTQPATSETPRHGRYQGRAGKHLTPSATSDSPGRKYFDVTKIALVSIALHLVFLTCAMLMVSDGSRGILRRQYDLFDEVNNRYMFEKSDIAAKGIYVQEILHQLREFHIQKRSLEIYPECLVRGVNTAHKYFTGLDLGQYPQVPAEVISWTEENCRKLHYTPRVFLYPGTGHLTGMARAKEALLTKIVHIKEWLAKRVRSRLAILLGEQPPNQTKKARAERESTRFYMPRHFTLTGCDTSPCRLIYNNPQSKPDGTQAPDEALLEAFQRRGSILQGFITCLESLITISHTAFGILLMLTGLSHGAVIMKHYIDWAPFPILELLAEARPPPVYTHHSIGIIVLCFLATFSFGIAKLGATLPPLVYSAFLSTGITSIVAFVFSPGFSPGCLGIKRLLHEVRTLAVEMGYLQRPCDEHLTEESPNNAKSCLAVPEATHSADISPSQSRRVSSFGQDLVEAIKKREEQATDPHPWTLSTAFMDVDLHSDSDIEDTEFVDAAESGGNTPGSDSDDSIVIVTGD
ncbi:hypothetical protein BCR34DRAFT_560408 [Clohesyomyces aquaticus]|uniref:Uncharacterized protein n=1 Tax=Clohesyomyces aquaticus TaxID=1231657 RepID=A0A1Y1ZW10_9PLEO|nr:hypothetical protein BCR34DRAFT_560408 [Clohesyomyces aquaticus]